MSAPTAHPRAATLATLLGLLALACSRSDPPPEPPLVAPSSAWAHAPDRLAPGELAEGTEFAFSLKLPSALPIRYRGPFKIHAEGNVKADLVANYVRRHVKAGSIELGATKTIFDQARCLNAPTGALLRIEVVRLHSTTRLVIHDLSERKADRAQPADQIWRIHGFDKDGKKFDTARVE